VLCYHAFSTAWRTDLAVPPERLEAELQFLLRRGYQPERFTDAVFAEPSRKVFAVTFDDGFRSVLTHAYPVLARLGVPGTLFVPTDFIDAEQAVWRGLDHWVGTRFESELTTISWDELRSLAGAGWEIGSHSCSHPRLTCLADEELDRELQGSKRRVEEELGRECSSIAYPYGEVDRRVAAAAERAGFRAGTTLTRLPHRSLPLAYPRVGCWQQTRPAAFRLKVSPAFRRLGLRRVA